MRPKKYKSLEWIAGRFIILTKNNTMIMEKRNTTMQIKEMANFIMYVLVEFVFSDSYMYFDLNLNAIIIKLHDEAIYIYIYMYIVN
jgi:hypothetical protein